jgi:hypothetical protein
VCPIAQSTTTPINAFELDKPGNRWFVNTQADAYVSIHAQSKFAAWSTGSLDIGYSFDGASYIAFSTPKSITSGAPTVIGIDVLTEPVPYLVIQVGTTGSAGEKVDLYIHQKSGQ